MNQENKLPAENVDDDKIALAYEKLEETYTADDDEVIKLLSEAIELYPNFVEAYFYRACNYWDLEQYEQAIQDFSKVIELNPGDNGAYLNRGKIYEQLGQYEKAIQDYSEVLENYPLSVSESWYSRGKELLEIYGWDPEPYYLRGDAYMKKKQYVEAIRDYESVISICRYTNDYTFAPDHNLKLCREALGK